MDSTRRLPLESYAGENGLGRLEEIVDTVARRHKDVIGVLAVGSMVQGPPPPDFYSNNRPGSLGIAYESIRRPERRRATHGVDSDLDLWICTRNTELSKRARLKVEMGGAALLEELASGTLKRGTAHWRDKKLSFFGEYYKNPELYKNNQNDPWMAHEFKSELEDLIVDLMPELVNNVSGSMNRSIPGNFLEIRAFPESLFHLRPDESVLSNGSEDRAPFPRIVDSQWIDVRHNAHVLFNRGVEIYPFMEEGDRLGSYIEEHIFDYSERENDIESLGAMMIKPDAMSSASVLADVRQKIFESINKYGGEVVGEKLINRLTDQQIEAIYPLMSNDDYRDLKDYLQSGPVTIIVIKLPLGIRDIFPTINAIKGPRVGDRSTDRLYEGRREDLAIRDLIPLPGDEHRYNKLISTILRKRYDPSHRFSSEDYSYYSRNLVHTPDNTIELKGVLDIVDSK